MKLRHLRVLPLLFVCMQLAFAQQWRVQSSGTAAALKKIHFVDSANGWTVGEKGTLLATSDGGAHWRRQTALDSTVGLTSLSFIDQHRGWVIGGYDAIAATSDGGSTWTRQTSPLRISMSDVRFTSRDTGWIVGSSRVLRTFDGGTSWRALDTLRVSWYPFKGWLRALHFVNNAEGWVVGFDGWDFHDSSKIYHTTDAGDSWEIQPSALTGGFWSVSFCNSQTGWAAGYFELYGGIRAQKTTDGGRHWVFAGPIGGGEEGFRGLACIDSSLVLLGSSRTAKVYRSTNGGIVWLRDSVEYPTTIESISCVDAQHCWACGSGGRIWRYDPTFISTNADIAPKYEGPVRSISILQHGNRVDVRYLLATPASIGTELYDVLGKKVAALPSIESGEGIRISSFDAGAFPSGVYYILSTVGGRRFVNTFARTK